MSTNMVYQNEVAECGLASLAMILSYYGQEYSLFELRQKFSLSSRGVNLKTLIEYAQKMSLSTRALQCELEELNQLKLPAVLHWDLNHFVVLVKVGSQKCVIHDPAFGIRTLSFGEVSKHFTGVALEAYPNIPLIPKKKTAISVFELLNKPAALTQHVMGVLGLSLFIQVISMLSPLYTKMIIDMAGGAIDTRMGLLLVLSFIAIVGVQSVSNFARGKFLGTTGAIIGLGFAQNLFTHLLKLPLSFFEKRHFSDVLTKFNAFQPVVQLFTNGIVEMVLDGIFAILLFIAMLVLNPVLAGVFFVVSSLLFVVRFVFAPQIKELSRSALEQNAKKEGVFVETLKTIAATKVFGKEKDRFLQWQDRLFFAQGIQLRTQNSQLLYATCNSLISGIENIISLYIAARYCVDGTWTIGTLMAYVQLKGLLSSRVKGLFDAVMSWQLLGMHLDRLADIALQEAVEKNTPLEISKGKIELKNIDVMKEGDLILHNFSVNIEAGECVAITGPSGCGKTTLLHCMMGLITPSAGSIFLDDKPLLPSSEGYTHSIAAVLQDDVLITGSILENITFFSEAIDYAQVEKVCKLTYLFEWIQKLPMGLQTLVGQSGVSGGQKQRILLARALYKNPKILFLDEASSNLDVELEQAINQNLKQLNMTRVMVAHRPQTIAIADRCILLTTKEKSLV